MNEPLFQPFDSVLVANRGEIAVRIIHAARAAGLRAYGVYSDVDHEASHVREADAAVRIGPAAAAESYLSIPALIAAAHRTGAQAVHPGYGFLSERADFAQAVNDAGLVFIGPAPQVMTSLGRKDLARDIAVRAGVPVMPRYDSTDGDVDQISPELFPVLVKAVSGGGGRGLRVVQSPADLRSAIESARREASGAFGDDAVLIERYIPEGRHIEVQVLGDRYGDVVHLFERDCSVQRRHQKVIEEAPAPTISAAVRDRLTRAAVAVCREVGYTNAGTVEFLVWSENSAPDGVGIAFLEMNTRLQVEHPVTELITGLDLVRLQFKVAAGEALPMKQDEIRVTGHAIEARIYAEDPYREFLPQTGTARYVGWPVDDARVDHALTSMQTVTAHYDPMLAKIIVHGETREAARRRLLDALDHTTILGLTSNAGFLRRLVDSHAYRAAQIHTSWLDHDPRARTFTVAPATPARAFAEAASAVAAEIARDDGTPFGSADSWRLTGPRGDMLVRLTSADGETHTERVPTSRIVGGSQAIFDEHAVLVSVEGQEWRFDLSESNTSGTTEVADGVLVSPMPGTVLSVDAATGQIVHRNDVLGVVEAMKMEYAIRAPHDAGVRAIKVAVGDIVTMGQVLFVLDEGDALSSRINAGD